jgi:hypothetical protein
MQRSRDTETDKALTEKPHQKNIRAMSFVSVLQGSGIIPAKCNDATNDQGNKKT